MERSPLHGIGFWLYPRLSLKYTTSFALCKADGLLALGDRPKNGGIRGKTGHICDGRLRDAPASTHSPGEADRDGAVGDESYLAPSLPPRPAPCGYANVVSGVSHV